MKIVFFGSGKFVIPSLEALLESHYRVIVVVTAPDKKMGRHLRLILSPTKELALSKNLTLFQPVNVNSSDSINYLKTQDADLFILTNFGQILSKQVLQIPKIFAINAHASLLPKYRGASPINWAIINGEAETGITIIKMNEFMDKGDIILREKIVILASDDSISLREKLSNLAASCLIKALDKIESGDRFFVRQTDAEASLAPKLKKQDGLIDWSKSAIEIHNRVRGLLPWPGSFTYYKNKLLKIYKAEVEAVIAQPERSAGTIVKVSNEGIFVTTGQGILLIIKLQLESGKIMDGRSFIAGHKINVGEKLG